MTSKSDRLIERLLNENEVYYVPEVLYSNEDDPGLFFWFYEKNKPTFIYAVMSIKVDVSYGKYVNIKCTMKHSTKFEAIVRMFRYIPSQVISEYFTKRGVEYISNNLPQQSLNN